VIVVKIELHSAVTGKVTEIGRAYIANDGNGTAARGNYNAAICRRGTTAQPSSYKTAMGNERPARTGRVENFPRKSYNVWRLVSRALRSCFPEEK
jgi:hypothetical protein